MQVCSNCEHVFDESEGPCPFCTDSDPYTHAIVFDKAEGIAKSVPISEAHLYED